MKNIFNRYKQVGALAVVFLLLQPLSALAQASINLEEVQAAVVNEKVLFTVKLNKAPLPNTATYIISSSPYRVIADLANTTYAKGRATVVFGHKIIQSMTMLSTGDRTRVIFDLNRNASFKADAAPNGYLITME